MATAGFPPNDGGLFICLLICLIIGGICFLIFNIFRPFFPWHYFNQDIDNKVQKVPLAWIFITVNFNDEEILERNGVIALMYLTWKRLCIVFTGVLSIITIPTLVPVYFERSQFKFNYFTSMSAAGLAHDDDAIGSCFVFTLLHGFSFVFMVMVFWAFYIFKKNRRRAIYGDISSHCVKVSGIPSKIKSEDEIQQAIEEIEDGKFSGRVGKVRIIWDNNKLISLQKKRAGLEDKIKDISDENYYKDSPKKFKPPVWKCPGAICCCKDKVDALEWHEEQLAKTNEKITAKLEKHEQKQKHIGCAYVTFTSANAAQEFMHHLPLFKGYSNSDVKAKWWRTSPTARPEHINWSNLNVGSIKRNIFRVILTIIMFLVALLWTIPIVFLSSLSNLEFIPVFGDGISAFRDTTPILASAVEVFIPVLLTIIFMALLPKVIDLLVAKLEKHHSVASAEQSSMVKFWIFVIFNSFILFVFFVSGLDLLLELLFDSTSVIDGFAEINFSITGAYYMVWFLTAGILGSALKLFAIPQLIVKLIKLKTIAKTAKKTAKLKAKASEYKYRFLFAKEAVFMPIILLYGAIVPVVMAAAFVYYTLSYLAEKTVIINGSALNEQRSNKLLHSFNVILLLGSLLVIPAWVFFFFTKDYASGVTAAVLYSFLLAAGIFVAIAGRAGSVFKSYREERSEWPGPRDPEDEDEEPYTLEDAYRHPGMRPLD